MGSEKRVTLEEIVEEGRGSFLNHGMRDKLGDPGAYMNQQSNLIYGRERAYKGNGRRNQDRQGLEYNELMRRCVEEEQKGSHEKACQRL